THVADHSADVEHDEIVRRDTKPCTNGGSIDCRREEARVHAVRDDVDVGRETHLLVAARAVPAQGKALGSTLGATTDYPDLTLQHCSMTVGFTEVGDDQW